MATSVWMGTVPSMATPSRGVYIASQDPVAADCLAAQLMGFKISEIGYLWYCIQKNLGASEIGRMEILGAEPQGCYHRFRLPPTYQAQKHWHDGRVSKLLGI
jgi:uncharacterized protein (DUF362 family)